MSDHTQLLKDAKYFLDLASEVKNYYKIDPEPAIEEEKLDELLRAAEKLVETGDPFFTSNIDKELQELIDVLSPSNTSKTRQKRSAVKIALKPASNLAITAVDYFARGFVGALGVVTFNSLVNAIPEKLEQFNIPLNRKANNSSEIARKADIQSVSL